MLFRKLFPTLCYANGKFLIIYLVWYLKKYFFFWSNCSFKWQFGISFGWNLVTNLQFILSGGRVMPDVCRSRNIHMLKYIFYPNPIPWRRMWLKMVEGGWRSLNQPTKRTKVNNRGRHPGKSLWCLSQLKVECEYKFGIT